MLNTPKTVTFISFVTVFLSLSVTLYTTLYTPALLVFTVFAIISTLLVISPSSLSVTFTKLKGLNVSPTFITVSLASITGSSDGIN